MAMRPPLVNVMAKAAEKAAKGLRRDFGEVEHLQISRKGPADFVSTADLNAQKILREELGNARPDFGFLMEEDDHVKEAEGRRERWIVDPLDGTTNFLHGVPHWAISIAVERDGEIIAGLIYAPIADEMFWAEKGLGAYQNSKRLRVSTRRDLSECLLGTGLPFKGERNADFPQAERDLQLLMPQAAGIRRMGAAALDMAYVAAGRYDAYWETAINIWDIAAGLIIVKEAGGFVSPLDPKGNMLHDGLVATNAEIHDKFVGMLRDARKKAAA